jgi:hypothetical protein
MKKRLLLFAIVISNVHLGIAQEKFSSNEQIIINFLRIVSAPHYKSRLGDFSKFFENEYEIEGGLRHEYAVNNPGKVLSWDDINSRSLAIDRFLADSTVKRLIILKNKNNYNWAIFSSYPSGFSTTIYVVGIRYRGGYFQIKMVNWTKSNPNGIIDILGPTGVSVYTSILNEDIM